MYNENRILAVIPARGGSKGLPGKNIRNLAGKPLVAWTIEPAKKSKYIDKLILSSDDREIIAVAKKYDCDVPFVRPDEFATDTSPSIDFLVHAIKNIPDYKHIMMLQPTSPLRDVADIDSFIEFFFTHKAKACVSVTETSKSPYWMYRIMGDCKMEPIIDEELIVRRQDLPRTYVLNGALYIAEISWLLNSNSFLTKETIAYQMPVIPS